MFSIFVIFLVCVILFLYEVNGANDVNYTLSWWSPKRKNALLFGMSRDATFGYNAYECSILSFGLGFVKMEISFFKLKKNRKL